MKPFEIFKAGRHTSQGGQTLTFGEDDVRAAVAAYDPAVHEAPIVVGHPADNHPAYGWIKGLSFADGAIVAEPAQIDADFAEMVAAGRFKKRSASFYTPDAANNPKPGAYYLRHVGFLGAQPPAVKGLKEVAFAADEAGVISFDEDDRIVASIFRGLREFLIAKFSIADADSVLPSWQISQLEQLANQPEADDATAQPAASAAIYSEQSMDLKQELDAAKAAQAKAEAALADANAKIASFAERETKIAAAEIEKRIDAIVAAGKMLPAQRAVAVSFAQALDAAEAVVSFGEGDKAGKVSRREGYLRQLEAGPKVIELGEAAGANKPAAAANAEKDVAAMNAQLRDQVAGKAPAKK